MSDNNATEVDPDEAEFLIPAHIRTRDELNEWEQANIAQAVRWLGRRKRSADELLAVTFLREVHRRMFSEAWRWAGSFRKSDKNIGVAWYTVPQQLQLLVEDTKHHLLTRDFPLDETAARFHHRLVQIHPFANGNGRHARLVTDRLLLATGRAHFSWGAQMQVEQDSARERYLEALRAADAGRFTALMEFVRN